MSGTWSHLSMAFTCTAVEPVLPSRTLELEHRQQGELDSVHLEQ